MKGGIKYHQTSYFSFVKEQVEKVCEINREKEKLNSSLKNYFQNDLSVRTLIYTK